MFIISPQFRASRAKKGGGKDGVVYFRISGEIPEGATRREERLVISDIRGLDGEVMTESRNEILDVIRLIYRLIEVRHDSGQTFTVDDVVSDYHLAVNGNPSMHRLLLESRNVSRLRSDVAKVSRDFSNCFQVATVCDKSDLSGFIASKALELRAQNQNSTSRSYRSLLNILNAFHGRNVAWSDVNAEFAASFAQFLSQRDISPDTASFYLNTLRSALNHAKREGFLKADIEPFPVRISKPAENEPKSSAPTLSKTELREIAAVNLSADLELDLARDMFMFSFYMQGMELIDVAHLTIHNLTDGFLSFRRRLKGKLQRLPVCPAAMEIIRKYRGNDSEYLFPLLSSGNRLFSSMRGAISMKLKELGRLMNCPTLTFSMSRSSWQAILEQRELTRSALDF